MTVPNRQTTATETVLPLTAAQSGMWYAQALDPLSPALNTGEYLEIDGPLDPQLFAVALRQVTSETEALRVYIRDTDDGPQQHVRTTVEPPLTVHDLRGAPDAEERAREWMHAELAKPCDLASGPLFKHALFHIDQDRWLWYQGIHHLVMDGFGYSLLVRRTAEIYTALARGVQPAPATFKPLADLVAEDVQYRSSEDFAADRSYWMEEFADFPEAPQLAGHSAPASRTFRRRTAYLAPETTARVRELATQLRATWPDVLIAAQAVYASRASGRSETVLGLPMMGRMGSVALRVPGMVMNVLPLRLSATPDTSFADLVRQVVLGIRKARRHQRYRYEDIRRDLRLLGGNRALVGPLVNVMPFDYGVDFAGAPVRAYNLSAGPVEDLTVNIYDRTDGRGLRFDHDGNPALYDTADLAAHQERFVQLVERLANADPQLKLASHGIATPDEHRLIIESFNNTDRELPATTLIEPISQRATQSPDATAVVFQDESVTYGQLNARANQLAQHLRSLGAGPTTLVAVAVPRSVELVVSLLAVLKTGAAYLPVDPDYPARRLSDMLQDAAPVCAITDHVGRLEETGTRLVVLDSLDLSAYPANEPAGSPAPADPAYVIYTSGSTGRPKGVVVSHAAIDNRLRWMQHEYGLTSGDRVLQKTPTSFDVSVWEFFWPLREGATLVVADPGGHKDPAYLDRLIREQAITVCHFVPSMLQVFLTETQPADHDSLRHVFASGEALPRETANAFARSRPNARLHNLYGPTEAAVDVSYHACVPDGSGPIPIGRPVWNTRLYVLDSARQPCPLGVAGELYIAGRQLADGYLNRPELTAERFVPDPFGTPDDRMYRTGDLARWRANGEVEYLGRTDHQVKLRGQRIELGEIEAALAEQSGVDSACALVREDRPGEQQLVGYVTGNAEPATVRAGLTDTLPEHMLPSAVVVLDAFPLSPNGKLDRRQLPAPVFTTSSSRRPRGHREETLTRLFGEVLAIETLGPEDSFFDLGGTSLLAVRLVARVREEFGLALTIGSVFAAPTPAALAARLDNADPAAHDALDVVLPLRNTGDRRPLFAFHPAGGIGWCYTGLCVRLGAQQPVYAIQARGLVGDEPLPGTLQEQAVDYVQQIRAVQPHGPYRLLGWSVGGVLAHTVAVLLQDAGEPVELLALLDAYPAEQWRDQPTPEEDDALTAVLRMAGIDRSTSERTREDVLARLRRAGSPLAGLTNQTVSKIVDIVPNHARMMREHQHTTYKGELLFFTAAAPRAQDWLSYQAWARHVDGEITNHDLACTHPQLIREPAVDEIAAILSNHLDKLNGLARSAVAVHSGIKQQQPCRVSRGMAVLVRI